MEYIDKIIKIQKIFRGYFYRIHRLPIILYVIQQYLQTINIKLSNETKDGRINSYINEDKIIDILKQKYKTKIKIPKIRMWYDVLIYDYI